MENNNIGKCGHAKCAGGDGCFIKGNPMTTYAKDQLYELVPIVGSGEYICEYKNCKTKQDDDSTEDVLFYGKDNRMFCKKHLPFNVEPVKN